ncbi:hypothetical protein V8C86DRAFT_2532972 [Haematococcus lacustris]
MLRQHTNATDDSGSIPKVVGQPYHGVTVGQERIYSGQQLIQALKSAVVGVRDQLGVLNILDNTAMAWPGMQQAVDDLEFLVDMTSSTCSRLEQDQQAASSAIKSSEEEVAALKEAVTQGSQGRQALQREVAALTREVKALGGKLEAALQEAEQHKQVGVSQELSSSDQQRASLASELERVKQDNEFMEGEISTLRATVTEQMQQSTTLKEELSAKKADVGHLTQSCSDQKLQIEHLSRDMQAVLTQLHDTQALLQQAQADRRHQEQEGARSLAESSRLGAELDKTCKELGRLKDWMEVVKKVDADKLKEEQERRMQDKLTAAAEVAGIEKRLAALQAEHQLVTQQLQAKAHEADGLNKQLLLAQLLGKDQQKHLATLAAEKAAVERQRDDATASAAQAQAQLQQASLAAVQQGSRSALTAAQLREEASSERARLVSAADEARRDAAVQKTLAEGWARDLRELQGRLREEQARNEALQSRLDSVQAESQTGRSEGARSAAGLEAELCSLRQQLDAYRVQHAEWRSERLRLEKHIEALQRECKEGALEVQRLRGGAPPRLPLLPASRGSIQEELESLKRFFQSMPTAVKPRHPSSPSSMVEPLPAILTAPAARASHLS